MDKPQTNETKERTWNLPLVRRPAWASPMENMPRKWENVHKVWNQRPLLQSLSRDRAPQQTQQRRTSPWQASGRSRGNRTPRGRSQSVSGTPCDQNVHLLNTTNDHHPVEYYTDDYQEEQCYSLETQQIHSVHTRPARKKYFVTLPISATGTKFNPMTFQIDTAATCNTLSVDALLTLLPNMKLTKSPYVLHPYGDAQPLKPLG